MDNPQPVRPNPKLKAMDQVRKVLRYYHYAYRTGQSYCKWFGDISAFAVMWGAPKKQQITTPALRATPP